MLRVKNLQAENAEIVSAKIQNLFAEEILCTNKFEVNNNTWSLSQDSNGFSLKSKRETPEGFQSASSLGVWDMIAILNGYEEAMLTAGNEVIIEAPAITFSIGVPKPASSGSLTLGLQNYRWGTLYTTTNPNVSSDRNVKRDIQEDLPDIVEQLRPVRYKHRGGPDTVHYGFIAQDVEEALEAAGVDTSDLGLVTFDTDQDGTRRNYALSYSEFIPLLVDKLQRQQKQIDELTRRIEALERSEKHG